MGPFRLGSWLRPREEAPGRPAWFLMIGTDFDGNPGVLRALRGRTWPRVGPGLGSFRDFGSSEVAGPGSRLGSIRRWLGQAVGFVPGPRHGAAFREGARLGSIRRRGHGAVGFVPRPGEVRRFMAESRRSGPARSGLRGWTRPRPMGCAVPHIFFRSGALRTPFPPILAGPVRGASRLGGSWPIGSEFRPPFGLKDDGRGPLRGKPPRSRPRPHKPEETSAGQGRGINRPSGAARGSPRRRTRPASSSRSRPAPGPR